MRPNGRNHGKYDLTLLQKSLIKAAVISKNRSQTLLSCSNILAGRLCKINAKRQAIAIDRTVDTETLEKTEKDNLEGLANSIDMLLNFARDRSHRTVGGFRQMKSSTVEQAHISKDMEEEEAIAASIGFNPRNDSYSSKPNI
ncbi:hypothetical protein V6N11_052363 [Hibiscus sabdariffa]|uniref:Uncharacterized protein n=1 Tax=Hibiscus sabdariffa TaxID=183260 RepID=A0ABR2UA80_9ROSI